RLVEEVRDDAREPPALPGKRGLAGLLTHEAAGGQALRPGLGHGVWVPRIGLVIARDDERRHIERLQLREPVERQRAWNLSQRTRDGLRVPMALHSLLCDPQRRLAPGRIDAQIALVRLHEA